jgi:hypothetical protein
MSQWLQQSGRRIMARIRERDPKAQPEIWPFKLSDDQEGWIVDAGNGLPARKVRSGWQSRSVGSFISRYSPDPLPWESRAEYAALLVLEYEWRPRRIRTQPFAVIHRTGKKLSKTFPDIEIVLADRDRRIIQVKSDRDLKDPRAEFRIERDRAAFELAGWKYDVWKESDLVQEPRHTTLKSLHYFRRHEPARWLIDRIKELLSSRQTISMGRLMEMLATEAPMEATLLPLVTTGFLRLDTRQRIAPNTIVSLTA